MQFSCNLFELLCQREHINLKKEKEPKPTVLGSECKPPTGEEFFPEEEQKAVKS